MACCKGSASWFCCYPDSCGCDGCCCQGGNCSGGCSSSSTCGQGACCTCDSNQWGFAWWNGGAYTCGITKNCNDYMHFTKDCYLVYIGWRRDTGPAQGLGRMVDFTKALFTQFAPLSQGIITNMKALTGSSSCC